MLKTITYYSDTDALCDPNLFSKCYRTVSEYRRRKTDSFVFDKDRRLSVGAEMLLRRALEDLGEDPDSIVFGQVANNKPVLRGSDISFNLSHSEQRVMCSVSDSDVGCDTELVKPIDLEIAKRYFYGSEYDSIASETDPDGRCDLFYRFWTLKESFMKATGLGFELPLDRFCIRLGETITVQQEVGPGPYRFREYDVGDGYRYAVCSLNGDFETDMRYTDLRL